MEQGKESLEARIQRLEDIHEIHNLKGRYCYYFQMHDFDNVAELFAKKDPYVRVEAADSGVYEGFDGVKRLYDALKLRFSKIKGNMSSVNVSTPVIEISRDGKTAKGFWTNFGPMTRQDDKGELYAAWVHGKYDDVFVKEDGKWMFRSVHFYVNFRTPFDQGWVKKPLVYSVKFADVKPDTSSDSYKPYDPNAFNTFLPGPPDPFE